MSVLRRAAEDERDASKLSLHACEGYRDMQVRGADTERGTGRGFREVLRRGTVDVEYTVQSAQWRYIIKMLRLRDAFGAFFCMYPRAVFYAERM